MTQNWPSNSVRSKANAASASLKLVRYIVGKFACTIHPRRTRLGPIEVSIQLR
jgi:hypothetical protein